MAAEEDSDNVDTLVRKESCAAAQISKKSFASRIKSGTSANNSTNPAPSPVLSVVVTPLTKSAKVRIGTKAPQTVQTASPASEMHKPASTSDICHNPNGHQNHSSQTNTLGSASGKTPTATTGPTAFVQPFTGFSAEQIEAARQRSIEAQNRKIAIVKLMRAKLLNKDDLAIIESVGCDICKKDNEGHCICPKHHGDIAELDNRHQGFNVVKSLPEGLQVKETSTPGAGRGVYTGQFTTLRKDMIYGPYEGIRIYNERDAHQSGYRWQIYYKRKISHWIDAGQDRRSNWLRYINCAATTDQQNVCAYQVGQNIYYRTVVDIGPDTELLVWYGDDYAKERGLHSKASMASINSSTINGAYLVCWDCQLEFRCRQPRNQHKFTAHDTVNSNVVAVVGTTRCVTNNVATRQVRDSVAKSGAMAYKPRIAGSACSTTSCVAVSTSCSTESEQHESSVGTNEGFGAISARLTDPVVNKCQVTAGSGFAGVSSSVALSGIGVSRVGVVVTDDDRRVHCSTCSMVFKTREDLIRHTPIHTAEKPFDCSNCGKRFTHRSDVTRHSRIHSGEKPFECTTCDQRFAQHGHLTRHSLIHTGEKPFECASCARRFTLNGDLKRHSNIHAGEKPFECTTCGQRFTRKGDLTKHSLLHTGEKPFECTACGRRFTQCGHLTRHSRIHTSERPFECATCGQSFRRNGDLTKHGRMHTGERQFECTTCGRRFTRNGDLTSHNNIHTGDKPFECTACGKSFRRYGDLTKHRLIHTERP